MKFPLISAVLAFSIQATSGLFGDKKFAKLDEEALTKIEAHLSNSDTTNLQEQVATLTQEKATLTQEKTDLKEKADSALALTDAVEQALELNGLKADESVAGIVLLGTKCKEYGDSKDRHATPGNDGKQKDPSSDALIDGVVDPNAAHNQIEN